MSVNGLPSLVIGDASDVSVAIVAAKWHDEICQHLIENSKSVCESLGISAIPVYRVAGSFELLTVSSALSEHHDVVIALGVIVQGETPHFEYISRAVTDGLARISVDKATPIGNGVLTTHTLAQAWQRCGASDSQENKGSDATLAAIDAALTLRSIGLKSNSVAAFVSKD